MIRYTNRGENQISISRFGNGPYEFGEPSVIEIRDNRLFVWDATSLKLITFGLDASPIDEITGFRWSLGDLAFTDHSAFAYNDGRSSGKYIQELSVSTGEVLSEYGEIDENHAFYKIYAPAGALAENDGNVYFMSPSSLKIHKINSATGDITSHKITDDEFTITEIDDARAILYNDMERVHELVRNSSFVMDMFTLENFLIVKTQVGEAVYIEEHNAYSLIEKKTKFHILDYESMNVIDTIIFSTVTQERPQSRYWTTNGKDLIHITHYPLNSLEPQNWKTYYFSLEDTEESQ